MQHPEGSVELASARSTEVAVLHGRHRCLSPRSYGGQIGLMGAKARKDGQMVEAVKIFLGGSMGAEPKLAELHEKAFPLGDLADVLELLLLEQFGARRRELAGS